MGMNEGMLGVSSGGGRRQGVAVGFRISLPYGDFPVVVFYNSLPCVDVVSAYFVTFGEGWLPVLCRVPFCVYVVRITRLVLSFAIVVVGSVWRYVGGAS